MATLCSRKSRKSRVMLVTPNVMLVSLFPTPKKKWTKKRKKGRARVIRLGVISTNYRITAVNYTRGKHKTCLGRPLFFCALFVVNLSNPAQDIFLSQVTMAGCFSSTLVGCGGIRCYTGLAKLPQTTCRTTEDVMNNGDPW